MKANAGNFTLASAVDVDVAVAWVEKILMCTGQMWFSVRSECRLQRHFRFLFFSFLFFW